MTITKHKQSYRASMILILILRREYQYASMRVRSSISSILSLYIITIDVPISIDCALYPAPGQRPPPRERHLREP